MKLKDLGHEGLRAFLVEGAKKRELMTYTCQTVPINSPKRIDKIAIMNDKGHVLTIYFSKEAREEENTGANAGKPALMLEDVYDAWDKMDINKALQLATTRVTGASGPNTANLETQKKTLNQILGLAYLLEINKDEAWT